MSEFKVGDRVRVIDNAEEYFGLVGKIESKIMDFMGATYYKVDVGEEFPYAFGGSQLEICVEKEDVKHKIPNELRLENLEKRIEKLEKCVMGEQNSSEKCENVSSISEFTKEEIENLKYFRDKGYIRVCKDERGFIHIFKIKPTIYNIEELLKGECGNE